MEFWRYYEVLRRRRWLVLLCMVVCIGTVYAYAKRTPQTYTGRTTLMERPAENRGVAVYNYSLAAQQNIEQHLADLSTIAMSSTVRQRALEEMATLNIVEDPETLEKSLKVEPIPGTQLLEISVTLPLSEERSGDAAVAASVVSQEFKRLYQTLVGGASEESRQFIEAQFKVAKDKLNAAQEKLRSFEQENKFGGSPIVQLDQQTSQQIQRIAQIEMQAIDARQSETLLTHKLTVLDQQIKTDPNAKEKMVESAEATTDNPVYQMLYSKMVQAEADLGTMRGSGRGDKHPDVVALKRQVDELKDSLAREAETKVSQHTKSLNQVYVQAIMDRMRADADKAGASAQKVAIESALTEEKSKMSALPAQQMELTQLSLEAQSATDTYKLLRQKFDEAKIKENESTKTAPPIVTIDEPQTFKDKSRKPLMLVLAAVMSMLLGAGLAFFLDYLDTSIRTPAEAEDLIGLPVTTVVSLSRAHALARRPDNEPLLATYEMLTATLWRTVAKSACPCVLVASAEPDMGRTTTVANLAVTLARDGARVILVDADMRKPHQHLMFDVNDRPGLSNILSTGLPIEDALTPTKIEGLLLMPAGPAPDNPIRLLRSEQMEKFVKQIGALADFVVFDSPAGVTFADAYLLASMVKNVVITHSAGKSPHGAESEFRSKLDAAGANILGVVLNRVRREDNNGLVHYRESYADLTAQSYARTKSVAGTVRSIPPGGERED